MQNFIKSNLVDRITQFVRVDFVDWLPKNWTTFGIWHVFLLPLSWFFYVAITIRKYLYQSGWVKSFALPVPVIVVGNIYIGGTGKTPLVIFLAQQFESVGLSPGIISRGYAGKSLDVQEVLEGDDPAKVGDEPLLIKRRTDCPVYVGRDRLLAGQKLLKENPQCDIIISDDGLQHYRLQRTVEIAVVDARTRFGNRALLPAGPLREPISRLASVDAIVTNGTYGGDYVFSRRYGKKTYEMQIEAGRFYHLLTPTKHQQSSDFVGKRIVAVTGIGYPEKFFQTLSVLNLQFKTRSFPDHHAFSLQDFADIKADVILMTEKDAVKCQAFAQENFWVLPIRASLDEDFMLRIVDKLESVGDW